MAGRGYLKGFLTKKMPQNTRRPTPWIQLLAPGLFPGIWEKAESEDTDGPESPEDELSVLNTFIEEWGINWDDVRGIEDEF
jgi:hypothetical protein